MGFCSEFKKLLKNSVITGIPQIVITRNLCKKTIKIMVFICCMVGFFWQTLSFLFVYWTYPTVVDVEYQFPDEFDLPAVSVCSYNSIKADVFCNRFPTMCYPNKSLDEFCTKYSYFCDPNFEYPDNESFPTIIPRELPDLSRTDYQEMGLKAEEIVVRCRIYNAPKVQECTGDGNPALVALRPTREVENLMVQHSYTRTRRRHILGSFRRPLQRQHPPKHWPRKNYQNVSVFDTKGLPSNCYAYNSLWGQTRGAQIIRTQTLIILNLKTDKTHRSQFYTASPFAIQMALHSPYSIHNPFRNGFSINPCSNYYIFPSKQINKLLPPPYTSACYNYTATWEARSGKGPLSKRLCAEECILNKSLEADNCVDPFYVTYPNMAKICKTEPPSRGLYKSCSSKCRPACNSEDISVDVQEHAHFSQRGTHKQDVCHSMIIIAFNRMELVKYSYSPKYESVSLFSYVGGYLGLWLGISLVAICDVLETAALVIRWTIQKYSKRRKFKSRVHSRQRMVFNDATGQMWYL